MGEIRPDAPRVAFFFAAFSGDEAILERLPELLAEEFGPIDLVGEPFDFVQTDYYARSMGERLRKQFLVLAEPAPAELLVDFKHRANALERRFPRAPGGVERPVNIDPGYVDLARVVLASTKDHAHRLYLGRGIHGEITLAFREKAWRTMPWTYPDYALPESLAFFSVVRERLHQRVRARAVGASS